MPNLREYGRSVICLVTGVSLVYQAEVASAQGSTSQLETNAQKAVGVLGKVAKLFSVGKDASDALELRDAKLAGQATKEQMERGVSAVGNLGKDASAAVAAASGGRLFSVTNAAVAPVLTSIAESEGRMLNRLTQAQQDYEHAVLRGNSSAIAAAGERLEKVRIEAAHFEPDTGSFWETAKGMASALSVGTKDASLAFLKNTVTGIGDMVSDLAEEEPTPEPEAEKEEVTGMWQEIRNGQGGECNISINMASWRAHFSDTDVSVSDAVCHQEAGRSSDSDIFEIFDVCENLGYGGAKTGSKIIFRTLVGKVDDDRFLVRQHMRSVSPSFDSGYQDADSYEVTRCKG